MLIRKATPKDSEAIAELFMMVMDSMVYRFIGKDNFKDGIKFFVRFIEQKENQYSYQNCFVVVDTNEVIGVINIYDGALLETLRQPILNYIYQYNNPEFTIEDETQSGEFYIDVIAVKPSFQGKGIGGQLLEHAIQKFCIEHCKKLGLLVEKNNPNAKKLYLKYGFEKAGEKTLTDHEMEHLQRKI